MKNDTSGRGFQVVTHPIYPHANAGPDDPRVVQQSSAIGEYPDAFERPGSSYLWVGEHHHLNREQVAELVARLSCWLATGDLFPRVPEAA